MHLLASLAVPWCLGELDQLDPMVQLVQPGQLDPMDGLDPRPASQLAQELPLELPTGPGGQIRSTVSHHVARPGQAEPAEAYFYHQM